jgi:Flp pilus assembly protein TadG
MKFSFRGFASDRRGVSALIFAALLVPMIAASGAAVDLSRASAAKARLQLAADNAALAGAGAYAAPNLSATAQNVAQAAFTASTADLAGWVSISAPPPTAAAVSAGLAVTVTATAKMKNSLLASLVPSETITVSATATNPYVNPGKAVTTYARNSSAWDWNRLYVYPVPLGANGQPNYNSIPDPTNASTCPNNSCAYELADNITTGTVSNPGPPVFTANDPIAFELVNVTGGDFQHDPNGYGKQSNGCPDTNEYGSLSQNTSVTVPIQDSTNILSSAFEALGESPSYSGTDANGNPYGVNHALLAVTAGATHCAGPSVTGANATYYEPNTYYADTSPVTTGPAPAWPQIGSQWVKNSNPNQTCGNNHQSCTKVPIYDAAPNTNCALMIEDQGTTATLAAAPPASGKCFDPTNTADPVEHPQYGSQTCAKYGTDNYALWWNDMGGGTDDLDYNDFDIIFNCAELGTAQSASGSGTVPVPYLTN